MSKENGKIETTIIENNYCLDNDTCKNDTTEKKHIRFRGVNDKEKNNHESRVEDLNLDPQLNHTNETQNINKQSGK